MKKIGTPGCQGAIFVYKDDPTAADAERELLRLNSNFPVTGEIHSNPDELRQGLLDWNQSIEPENAFLCIYAHMGKPGISCVGEDGGGRIVTWEEIASALPKRVEVLWLVGCTSQYSMDVWIEGKNPVLKYLVATSKSEYFLPLVPLFRYEISINPVFYFDEMPLVLEYKDQNISSITEYHERTGDGFRQFVTEKKMTEYLENKINRL